MVDVTPVAEKQYTDPDILLAIHSLAAVAPSIYRRQVFHAY
jgi:hypothetical protein